MVKKIVKLIAIGTSVAFVCCSAVFASPAENKAEERSDNKLERHSDCPFEGRSPEMSHSGRGPHDFRHYDNHLGSRNNGRGRYSERTHENEHFGFGGCKGFSGHHNAVARNGGRNHNNWPSRHNFRSGHRREFGHDECSSERVNKDYSGHRDFYRHHGASEASEKSESGNDGAEVK
ncbi:MAG: hypothetical protein K6G00_11950 [Treponema sp.]|nr:hypothetical protein [Treponema sp.]